MFKAAVYSLFFISGLFLSGCSSPPNMPESQKEFLKLNKDYYAIYKSGDKGDVTAAKRESIQKQAVADRNNAIKEFEKFENWEVSVSNVSSDDFLNQGQSVSFVVLETKFGFNSGRYAGISLDNSNRKIIGASDNVILESSPLYKIIVDLKKEQTIYISGFFLRKDNGFLFEKSLTDSGSMYAPEFIVTFTDIKLNL
jgi:hypothetical protein